MSAITPSFRSNRRNGSVPLPEPIRMTIDQTRMILGRYILSQAIVLILVWSILVFWLFGWIDYLPAWLGASESPRWIRACMLMGLMGGVLYLLYQQVWKRWLVRWSDHAIALLIERRYPSFQSSLITTVQAAQPTVPLDSSTLHPNRDGLLALSRDSATRLITDVKVEDLVLKKPLQIQLLLLGICLAASSVLLLLLPQWSFFWAKRFFALSDAPWPRNVSLGVDGVEFEVPTFSGTTTRQRYMMPFEKGRLFYPRGQSGQLKSFASLSAKKTPESCTVYYYDAEGNRGRANMRRLAATDKKLPFLLDGPPLESLNQSMSLSILGGDARISDLTLEVVDAPMVVELQLDVTYPDYLQRSTQSRSGKERIPYRTGLRIPMGCQVDLTIKSNKTIRKCDYVFARASQRESDAREQSIDIESPSESVVIPLGKLEGNVLAEIRLWDSEGICSSRIQQYVISAIVDNPPQVDMVLDGIGTAITESAMLPIVAKVKDEYDIDQTWFELVPAENQIVRIESTKPASANLQIEQVIDCKELRDTGKLALKPKTALAISLAASDFYNLSPESHVGRGNMVQLSVVTPDELLLILDRREAAMRRRLEQIIGEVTQLRDLLLIMERKAEVKPSEPGSDPNQSEQQETQRHSRLKLLRSQQAMSQVAKSEGELNGVEKEILQIAKELINNRVESVDRRTRWQEKIQKPLRSLLDTSWAVFSLKVSELEKLLSKSPEQVGEQERLTREAVEKNNEILVALQSILSDMLEIQDQTAIIDMLRDIIDDNGDLIQQTKGLKKEQERRVLDLLK